MTLATPVRESDAARAQNRNGARVGDSVGRGHVFGVHGSRAAAAVAAVAVLAALAARLATGPHPIDDAFITFRYARNLAEGVGLVYNPGEWVLGTTAPLWALVLAGAYRVGLTDLPTVASSISAVCDAASAGLLVLLGLRIGWNLRGAVCVGLAWALNPMSIAFAVGGMETSLFVLLVLSALTLGARGKMRVASVVAGAGVAVRPESALVAVTIVGWTLLRQRRDLPVALAGSMLPPMALCAALVVMYGSPVPNSVAAKQVAYQMSSPVENLLAILVTAGLPGWSNHLVAVLPTGVGFVLAAVGLATLAYLARLGLLWLDRRGVQWQPFAVFFVLCVAFYTLIGLRGVRMFSWYLVPLLPLVLLAAAAGLARIAAAPERARIAAATERDRIEAGPERARLAAATERARKATRGPRMASLRPRRWLAAAAAALLVVWQLPAVDWHRPLLPTGHELVREQALLQAGHDLRASLPPDATLAAPEIGALGYASNLRILDTVGLVSPMASRYYPLPAEQAANDNAIPPRLIEDLKPDAVVTLDAFARTSLMTDAAFVRDYQLARSYPAAVWRSQEVLVFTRRER